MRICIVNHIIQGQQKRSHCSSFGRTSFSQGKNEIQFFLKASNKQSACVIFGLIRLTVIEEKAYQEVQDYWPPIHVMLTRYSVVLKAK